MKPNKNCCSSSCVQRHRPLSQLERSRALLALSAMVLIYVSEAHGPQFMLHTPNPI